MRYRFISILLLAGAGVLASCHQTPGRTAVAPARRDGSYDYVALVSGIPFGGVLHVVSDTVVLDVREGACFYDPGSVSTTSIRYKCEGPVEIEDLVLLIDRHDPVSSSHWTASAYRNVQHRVCDTYTKDASGRSVCASSHVETERRKETTTGMLTVKAPGV